MTPLEIASIAALALFALFVLSCACLCSCRCLLRQRRSRLRAGDVMIISGASSGIGEHVAYRFARQGLHLVLAARRFDRLRGVAARCGELGAASATPVQADVTSGEDCVAVVQRAIDRHGRVDALVVNAGVGCFAPVTDLEGVDKLLRVMDVNYWGAVRLTLAALPALRTSSGRIGVISSLGGRIGSPYITGYAPTKHALHGFFNSLRCEVSPYVAVTIVCPGAVVSEMHFPPAATHDVGPQPPSTSETGEAAHAPAPASIAAQPVPPGFLRTDVAASRIAACINAGQREATTDWEGSVGLLLAKLAPELLDTLARQRAAEALAGHLSQQVPHT